MCSSKKSSHQAEGPFCSHVIGSVCLAISVNLVTHVQDSLPMWKVLFTTKPDAVILSLSPSLLTLRYISPCPDCTASL